MRARRSAGRRYFAFVHLIGGTRALPIAALRTVVAFRGESQRPTEVLYVTAAGDSVGLDHPIHW